MVLVVLKPLEKAFGEFYTTGNDYEGIASISIEASTAGLCCGTGASFPKICVLVWGFLEEGFSYFGSTLGRNYTFMCRHHLAPVFAKLPCFSALPYVIPTRDAQNPLT